MKNSHAGVNLSNSTVALYKLARGMKSKGKKNSFTVVSQSSKPGRAQALTLCPMLTSSPQFDSQLLLHSVWGGESIVGALSFAN